jgi:hypothetical protein
MLIPPPLSGFVAWAAGTRHDRQDGDGERLSAPGCKSSSEMRQQSSIVALARLSLIPGPAPISSTDGRQLLTSGSIPATVATRSQTSRPSSSPRAVQ